MKKIVLALLLTSACGLQVESPDEKYGTGSYRANLADSCMAFLEFGEDTYAFAVQCFRGDHVELFVENGTIDKSIKSRVNNVFNPGVVFAPKTSSCPDKGKYKLGMEESAAGLAVYFDSGPLLFVPMDEDLRDPTATTGCFTDDGFVPSLVL